MATATLTPTTEKTSKASKVKKVAQGANKRDEAKELARQVMIANAEITSLDNANKHRKARLKELMEDPEIAAQFVDGKLYLDDIRIDSKDSPISLIDSTTGKAIDVDVRQRLAEQLPAFLQKIDINVVALSENKSKEWTKWVEKNGFDFKQTTSYTPRLNKGV